MIIWLTIYLCCDTDGEFNFIGVNGIRWGTARNKTAVSSSIFTASRVDNESIFIGCTIESNGDWNEVID